MTTINDIGCPLCSEELHFQAKANGNIHLLVCQNGACGYRVNYGTAVDLADGERIAEIRASMAKARAAFVSRLNAAVHGPEIPESVRQHVEVDGFRFLSLNRSELKTVSDAVAGSAGRGIPKELLDAIPHAAVSTDFMRPEQNTDLWCLPRLSWVGDVDPGVISQAAEAFRRAVADESLLLPTITPEQFHQRRLETEVAR